MAKPVVIVVGADKGGVGKTTVSRTLLDYFDANNIPTRAFDTESPRGTLKRFHPDITEIVDLTTTSDQMKIFDTLNAAAPSVTVIDVRAGLMSPALGSLRDIGFLDAAKSGQITFAVFHMLGPSIASLDEIAATANFMQGAKYFLVKNFVNDTHFFEWDKKTYNFYFRKLQDATELSIPKLNEMAFEQVEVASVPFRKFVANKGVDDEAAEYSFVLRGYVRSNIFVHVQMLGKCLNDERASNESSDATGCSRASQRKRSRSIFIHVLSHPSVMAKCRRGANRRK
jgi:hypothetical protein